MIKISAFVAFILFFPAVLSAQSRLGFNTKDGDVYAKGYLYTTFQDGKLFSKDGSRGVAKMNYNRFTNEMLFISAKSDTLKLAHPEETVMVVVAADTFYFFKNMFYKKMTHYGKQPDLLLSQELKYMTTERPVPYGYSSTTVSSAMPISDNRGVQVNVGEDKNLVFRKSSDMVLLNGQGDCVPVKQATFFNMLPQFKSEMEAFIKKEKTSFKNVEDVTKFVAYVHTLQ